MLLIGEYTEFPAWLPADPGSGIALFNSTEGAEPLANTVLSVHNPSFLCADGYGGFYALDEGPQGLLTHFIPDGKSFYLAEQVAFEAQGSCHLCVSPEHKIYISNYDSGTLTVVSDNNGHLEVIQTLYFHGSGPVKSRQSASHIHSCRLSPNGRELFAADLGGDRLYRFDIQKDGRLNKHIEQPYIQLPGGSGPRHMDFHPNSRFMYISAELSNQIFTLCFNENGVASVVSCISTTECKGPTILTAHLQVSEQYNMLYTCVRGTDEIAWYPTTTFSEACNIGDGYYKDENGQFQWAPADTRTLDALKKYQDLYQEGILDSEFYSYTRYQGAQKFYVQGTSGLTLEDGHAIMITYIRNGLAEQGLDPDKVLHLAQLVGDDGMYHYREDSNYWGQVMFSPTISQEKFERAMDILDYTCTEEGQNIMNMGFEGIDWKRDENGNYVSLLDPSIQGSATSVLGGKYPSKESSFGGLILPDDFSLVSPNYNHEIQNTVRNFYKLREELSDETTLLPREYEYEFLSSREKSQATMDLGDEYAKLVLKDGDLEDNWNTWVEEKMAVVQPVLDQLNK